MLEPILFGVLAGCIAGVIPGIGVFVALLISYPLLINLDIITILIFYLALSSTTQYIGSIPATFFAVPGENSSVPALYEGNAMFKKGEGALAISGAALGSILGSFVVLLFFIIAGPLMSQLKYFITSYVQFIFICLTIFIFILSSKGKWYVAALLAAVGYYIGSIGCSDYYGCFGPEFLMSNPDVQIGIPLLPFLSGVFVFPLLLKVYDNYTLDRAPQNKILLKDHLNYFKNHIPSSLRGSLVAFAIAYLPGIGQTVCSNLSYRLEMYLNKNYKLGDYKCLVAAETSNNSAILINLIPLFLLGIPTGASEVLLFEIASSKAFWFVENFTYELFIYTLVPTIIIANLLAFSVAWPFAKSLLFLQRVNQKYINIFCFILLVIINAYLGSLTWSTYYYLSVFFLCLPIGYLLRKQDVLPMIFTFILAGYITSLSISLPDLITIDLRLLFG